MESKEMKKTMGAAVALSMVVGCVIGSGVFFKPQAIYTATGGAPGIGILSWIIGGWFVKNGINGISTLSSR